jgi:hypothetical protein
LDQSRRLLRNKDTQIKIPKKMAKKDTAVMMVKDAINSPWVKLVSSLGIKME